MTHGVPNYLYTGSLDPGTPKNKLTDLNQNETQHTIDLLPNCVATHNANLCQRGSTKSPRRISFSTVDFV